MARFTLPRDTYHGKGALEALKSHLEAKGHHLRGRRLHEEFGFLDRAVRLT